MKIGRITSFLYLIPVVLVGFQFFFSSFSTLSPWKGGGFGMYTSQHPDDRGILIEYKGDTSIYFSRIYPFPHGKPDSSLAGLEFLFPDVPQLLVFPTSADLSGIEWTRIRKWAEKKRGRRMENWKISLLVTEPIWNLNDQSFTTKIIFKREI